MVRLRGAALVAIAVCVVAAAPSSADSGQRKPVHAPFGFQVGASNGYSMIVYGDGEGVIVYVARKGASVTYAAPGSVTDRSIDADLGRLGEIHLSFRPQPGIVKARASCTKDTIPVQRGVYVGTLRFEGEGGFTRVERTQVSARPPEPLFESYCLSSGVILISSNSGPGHPQGADLHALSESGPDDTSFEVLTNSRATPVLVSAIHTESRAGITIQRAVFGKAGPASFRRAPRLGTATVRPPSPFKGSARFDRARSCARRWTGSLRVSFPGLPALVRLAGEGFETTLDYAHYEAVRRNSVRRPDNPCNREIPRGRHRPG